MKFFLNRIFIGIFIAILLMFSLQFYFLAFSYKRDTNTYVTLIKGIGEFKRDGKIKNLEIDKKILANNGDTINTGNDSLLVIEWGDKSITRISSFSEILINENNVSSDLSEINISFELKKGKSWSNVISIFGEKSYFKQNIKGVSASVRGTVYEADYDKDYIVVYDHEVSLKNKDGKTANIQSGEYFSLSTFSVILKEISNTFDKTFKNINEKLDKDYLKKLRNDFVKLMDINKLKILADYSKETKLYKMIKNGASTHEIKKYMESFTGSTKKDLNNFVIKLNQYVNFENGEDVSIYKIKERVNDIIMDMSVDDKFKIGVIKAKLYDLSKMIDLGKINKETFNNTMKFFKDNSSYLKKLSLDDFKSIGKYGEYFNELFTTLKNNFDIDNVKNKMDDLEKISKKYLDKGLKNILKYYKDLK